MRVMSTADLALPDGYQQTLETLKHRVHSAQIQAQRTINTELIQLYWSIGKEILLRQEQQGWGSKIIARNFRRCGASPLGICNI